MFLMLAPGLLYRSGPFRRVDCVRWFVIGAVRIIYFLFSALLDT